MNKNLKVKVIEQSLKGQCQQNPQKAHLQVVNNQSVEYEISNIQRDGVNKNLKVKVTEQRLKGQQNHQKAHLQGRGQ